MNAFEKVIYILELFLDNKEELSLSEISTLTGLNKSTVNRISSFLTKKGYLEQPEKRGKYSLGIKFLDFNTALKNKFTIRNIAMRYLENLSQLVKETCGLTIWDGNKAIFADVINHSAALSVSPDIGSNVPLNATSVGKILLASMDSKEINNYFNNTNMEKYTSHTITDPTILIKKLKLTNKRGYSFDINEHYLGISSVAAGIKDHTGNILGAICVIGPTARLTRKKLKSIAPDVKNCAFQISKSLGWDDR